MYLNNMQREILAACGKDGGITAITAEKNGWTHRSMPTPDMRELINRRIIAPRVLTSQPLRIVWQLRDTAKDKNTLHRIEQLASKFKMKEYAPGGFKL